MGAAKQKLDKNWAKRKINQKYMTNWLSKNSNNIKANIKQPKGKQQNLFNRKN